MGGYIMSPRQFTALKNGLFLLCLVPLASLVYRLFSDALGANPIEALTRGLGDWTLRFLLITLAVTPLRRISGLNWLLKLRRMLGLYAFSYALLHFASYVWLDQFFDWNAIWKDIIKRPFITVGFASLLLLFPLAATSTNAMIKRLGGRRWQMLHRAVYAIGMFAVLHYWWMVKKDITQPAIYAAILTLLLGARVYWMLRRAGAR